MLRYFWPIGIDRYHHLSPRLRFAARDAEAFRVLFEQLGFESEPAWRDEDFGYGSGVARDLQLHLGALRARFEAAGGGVLVIYLAGHGATAADGSAVLFKPHGREEDLKDDRATSYIHVQKDLNKPTSTWQKVEVFIIHDICRTTLGQAEEGDVRARLPGPLTERKYQPGAAMLYAALPGRQSFEIDSRQGGQFRLASEPVLQALYDKPRRIGAQEFARLSEIQMASVAQGHVDADILFAQKTEYQGQDVELLSDEDCARLNNYKRDLSLITRARLHPENRGLWDVLAEGLSADSPFHAEVDQKLRAFRLEDEAKAFDQAEKADKETAWQAFIEAFPDGERLAEAKLRLQALVEAEQARVQIQRQNAECEAWGLASRGNLAELLAFIDAYPASPHVADANARLAVLRKELDDKAAEEARRVEDTAWMSARKAGVGEIEAFISRFPGSEHIPEARRLIESLQEASDWERCKKSGIGDIEQFLQRWPSGNFAMRANDRLKVLRAKVEADEWKAARRGGRPALEAFAARYPTSPRTLNDVPKLIAALEGGPMLSKTAVWVLGGGLLFGGVVGMGALFTKGETPVPKPGLTAVVEAQEIVRQVLALSELLETQVGVPEPERLARSESLYQQGNLFAGLEIEHLFRERGDGASADTWAIRNRDADLPAQLLRIAEQNENPAIWRLLGRVHALGLATVEKDDLVAIKWISRAAESGNAAAQNNLGWMYFNGRGVDQSDAEAVKWYRLAADQGNAYAQRNLGWMYELGRGVEKNDVEAVRWYRLAAEQGSAGGLNNLGTMYLNGRGVDQSDAEAVKWYRLAAEQGNSDAHSTLGWMHEMGRGVEKDYTEAFHRYRYAAERGKAGAQASLGNLYVNGRGVEKDFAEGVKWYRLSAEQGDARGQFGLAWAYAGGHGVKADLLEAAKWYRRAADQGNAGAQYNLGVMYRDGHGVDKDEKEGFRLNLLAAEQGNRSAQFFVGLAYKDGQGVKQDDAKAFEWIRKAAQAGDSSAQSWLGFFYENGRGVGKDLKLALTWYRKAAEQGNSSAQRIVGHAYHRGQGVEQDDAKAFEWMQKAAQEGDSSAQSWLGFFYENGRGVGKDLNLALTWYRKAAEGKVEYALEAVKRLEALQTNQGTAKHSTSTRVSASNQPAVSSQAQQEIRYSVHANGTVTDTKKGLMWSRCSFGQDWKDGKCQGEIKSMTLDDARLAIERSSYAGYTDWRLPTADELDGLVVCPDGKREPFWTNDKGEDHGGACVAPKGVTADRGIFFLSTFGAYWSDSLWAVSFNDGSVNTVFASHKLRSLAVRDAE